MGCGSGLTKCLLFVFNLVFALAGLALLGVGIYQQVEMNNANKIIDSAAVAAAPILVIVIGAIVFGIAFFGCCGAIKESTCMLTFYGIILLSIFIIQIAIGIFAVVTVKDDDNKTFYSEVRKAVSKTKERYFNDEASRESFNFLQQSLKCCGIDSYRDWPSSQIPSSCCNNNLQVCQGAIAYPDGCAKKLYETIQDNIETIGYVAIGLCATELIAAIFAFCLSSSIKNERRRGFA